MIFLKKPKCLKCGSNQLLYRKEFWHTRKEKVLGYGINPSHYKYFLKCFNCKKEYLMTRKDFDKAMNKIKT